MDYGPAPEAADLAHAWLDGFGRRFGCFVGGEFRKADEAFAVFNPANGGEIAQVAQGSAEDVDRAVEAARGALAGWRALGGHGRARFLYA
ncbi:MAG: aldehyde dehydrogenase family protein, partial [Fimbriimonadaceae bacterium]|nr:aldehyde dehydrogenase family protein [Fimbriimonadaceae bacterium]